MLAYVFWHRPKADADREAYELAQRSFHASLDVESASFRLAELPFTSGAGYEDWYLAEDWQSLGELSRVAIGSTSQPDHDRVAAMSANGWGGVYSLVRGSVAIPDDARWLDKPRGQAYEEFVGELPAATTWQRQMVLGPAPEFCTAAPPSTGRERIWPPR